MIRLGNNEVLKTLTKTLTFVDADANADAGGSKIHVALPERCSGELKSIHLDPVVQNIVSLMSSLVVKMLTVLVSTISNSQIFLLKKCEELLQMQKLLTFFSKIAYMPYLMIKHVTIL